MGKFRNQDFDKVRPLSVVKRNEGRIGAVARNVLSPVADIRQAEKARRRAKRS